MYYTLSTLSSILCIAFLCLILLSITKRTYGIHKWMFYVTVAGVVIHIILFFMAMSFASFLNLAIWALVCRIEYINYKNTKWR